MKKQIGWPAPRPRKFKNKKINFIFGIIRTIALLIFFLFIGFIVISSIIFVITLEKALTNSDPMTITLLDSSTGNPLYQLDVPEYYLGTRRDADEMVAGKSLIGLWFTFPDMQGYSAKYHKQFSGETTPNNVIKVFLLAKKRKQPRDIGSWYAERNSSEYESTPIATKINSLDDYQSQKIYQHKTDLDRKMHVITNKEGGILYVECNTNVATRCRAKRSINQYIDIDYNFYANNLIGQVVKIDIEILTLIKSFKPRLVTNN